MDGPPQFSVIVPVHNGENYVRQAIESALSQTGVTTEVIVVDDASTDGTRAVVEAFGNSVRFVSLPKQSTSIATTNAGIALAGGDLIGILHHDDYYLPDKLVRHAEVMAEHPEVGLSYSAQHYVDHRGRWLWTLRSPVAHRNYVVPGETELHRLVVQNYINFSNAVIRRSAYEEVGPYSEPLWWSAEWEMWMRIALRHSVAYLDSPLVAYRLHPNSQTMAATLDTADFLMQLRNVVDTVFSEPRLTPALVRRRQLSMANQYLTTSLLQFMRHEWGATLRNSTAAASHLRPWQVFDLVRSSAIVPRMISRLRMGRRAAKTGP
jgi:glycosyltransferase involved in cell wall biosynthesis